MNPTGLLIVYCLLIFAASLAGGWIPLLIKLTHRRMQLAVSLVAGFMLGVGLLHMFAHAAKMVPSIDAALIWLLVGFLVMFFIERFFCFHHHDVEEVRAVEAAAHGEDMPHEHDHAHDHDHDEDHDHAHGHGHGHHDHALTWSGAAVGLTLHSIIAGIALAAAVSADAHLPGTGRFAGFAVFLVIMLHKPFDSMTVITLTTVGGWSTSFRHGVNGLFALAVPAGAMLFAFGFDKAIASSPDFVGYALAFSSGTFLCVAMSDLLPELQFHHHDRGKLSAALLLGLALAWGAAQVEGLLHDHDHGGHDNAPLVDEHAGHDH
jgi:zinc and cadmium transporter